MQPEDLISRGFFIFPCKGKMPLVKWSKEASNDLTTIRNWKARFPNCDWGINCGMSNLAVIDVDSGKTPSADDTLFDLQLNNSPLPPTFKVKTRSGGYHLYYRGFIKNSASKKLGKGLDTRGQGGFVVAPGSTGYEVIQDLPIAQIPSWITAIVGQPEERIPEPPPTSITLDTPYAIAQAIHYLESAPIAIEGEGGDTTTFKVACHVRDLGISHETCLQLMLEHWDERCEPPWGADLATKVLNAYNYAENAPGTVDPSTVFPVFIDPVADPLSSSTDPAKKSMFIDAVDLINRKMTINYLVSNLIETPATGLMFGNSGTGKSFLAIDLALSVATGRGWLANPSLQGSVFYLAGEGQKGIPRRLKAWLTHHSQTLPPNALKFSRSRIEMNSASAIKMKHEIDSMALAYGPPALIIVDTLARHLPEDADENSAKDIGAFINAVDYLKDAFHCVVLVIHHSGKRSQDSSRGSSALKAALDFEIQVRPGIVQYTKQKDGDLPGAFGFVLEDVALEDGAKSAVVVPSSIDPTAPVDLTARELIALDTLKMEISQGGGSGAVRAAWQRAFSEKLGEGTPHAKNVSFLRCEASLLKQKVICVKGGLICLTEAESED